MDAERKSRFESQRFLPLTLTLILAKLRQLGIGDTNARVNKFTAHDIYPIMEVRIQFPYITSEHSKYNISMILHTYVHTYVHSCILHTILLWQKLIPIPECVYMVCVCYSRTAKSVLSRGGEGGGMV